jgi:hypothetical protein
MSAASSMFFRMFVFAVVARPNEIGLQMIRGSGRQHPAE